MREQQWQQEQTERALIPKPSRAELDGMDPHSAIGKAKALEELNLHDPVWRARNGLPVMDALVALKNQR